MADYNYSNPSGMAPKIGWSPQGFLAGNMYYDQEQDYRKSIGQAHTQGDMAIRQREAEYQDYLANAPVRESKRGLDISTNRAMAPIQGDIAGALGAEARGRRDVAPSAAKAGIFKNEQVKKAMAEEDMSGYLSSVLQQYGDNPMAAMTVWRDQIVPQLEQKYGEKFPDQFRAMDINQMATHNNALLQNRESRRAVLLQRERDSGAMDRTRAEVAGRDRVAEVRGDTENAARIKAQQRQYYEDALLEQYQREHQGSGDNTRTTEADMQRLRNRARTESYRQFYSADVSGRGAEARDTNANKDRTDRLRVERIAAPLIPRDPRERRLGSLYKTSDNRYVRWTERGALLEND